MTDPMQQFRDLLGTYTRFVESTDGECAMPLRVELERIHANALDAWHMANGVADLAMKHRDAAEAALAQQGGVKVPDMTGCVITGVDWTRNRVDIIYEKPAVPIAPAARPADQDAVDAPAPADVRGEVFKSRVADLLHLLEFATITTPSEGDAEQARKIMATLRALRGPREVSPDLAEAIALSDKAKP